jgi:hypothetical protein
VMRGGGQGGHVRTLASRGGWELRRRREQPEQGSGRGNFGVEGAGCGRMAHRSGGAGPAHWTEKVFRNY